MGTQGALTVDALLVRDTDKDQLVLVVDHDLHDIPTWVDWEIANDNLGIAQQNGAYATISISVDPAHREALRASKRLLLVTRQGDENVVHHVPFITRM